MKSFTAYLTKNGKTRIITVKANNEIEADLTIRSDLNTSSRQSVLDQWIRNGAWIVETTNGFTR